MFCQKCGNQLAEGGKFCEKCGATVGGNDTFSAESLKNTASSYVQKTSDFLKNSRILAINDNEASEYDVSNNQEVLDDIFVEPDEHLLAKLGNGYLVNLLFKRIKKCNALLTDKRVYLKGAFYSADTKNIFRTTEERILDLENITGTGFIYTQCSKMMILLGILLSFYDIIFIGQVIIVLARIGLAGVGAVAIDSLLFVGLNFILVFVFLKILKSRRIFFFIDYAGGRIKIDAKLIGLSDVQDFHKQMRRAKDAITGKK